MERKILKTEVSGNYWSHFNCFSWFDCSWWSWLCALFWVLEKPWPLVSFSWSFAFQFVFSSFEQCRILLKLLMACFIFGALLLNSNRKLQQRERWGGRKRKREDTEREWRSSQRHWESEQNSVRNYRTEETLLCIYCSGKLHREEAWWLGLLYLQLNSFPFWSL